MPIPKEEQLIRFQMFCNTCGKDLEYDPEVFCNPLPPLEPAVAQEDVEAQGYDADPHHAVYAIDTSWHVCGCDESEGDEPDWVIRLLTPSGNRN